ncbi:MAG: PIF1 family ATP-dependent DNA helicase [Candidatus Pacebacteria bacterium]|nr:PIF1 family ATP-dependent DNA helicase [Candidatus Paceibacterota bacterium]
MNQDQAFKILKSQKNIFLTGPAGTGKTFLLNRFIEYSRKKKIRVGITASTGIAATHIGGRTVHSWSGMGVKSELTEKELKKLLKRKELLSRIKEVRVLIIDEISMLDAPRLDLLDEICKAAKESFLPFGGTQIIMCGDFFQLPPVDPKNQNPILAYNSKAWSNSDIKTCYLDEQHRQDDPEFLNILNTIRSNQAGEDILLKLKARLYKPLALKTINPIKLYTHNVDVDAINNYELSKIPEKEFNYEMMSYGPKELVKSLKKNCLAPEHLSLKVGAMVIFVKNNFGQGYVNGTLGKVIDFDEGEYPIVETESGDIITATLASWNIEEDEKTIANISQIPLRLAWAITIHKSQGMTIDAAEIDLSKSFEYGMGYVALSRVRTLDSIKLMGINEMALKVNPEIVEKDIEFRSLSQ